MSKTKKGNASGETRPRLSFRRAQVVLIAIVIAFIALAAASANRNKTSPTVTAPGPIISKPAPAASQGAASSQERYLRRAYLTPEVQTILAFQGDRFERPGKERLVLMGTLTRPREAGNEAHAFRLMREFPARLRFEEQVGFQTQVWGFNQGQVWVRSGIISEQEQETLETLVFDSADHFFGARLDGLAMRLLGTRFRLDGGSNEDYAGPVYDIYQLLDFVQVGGQARQQPKFFCFNTNTLLLEQVSYEMKRNSEVVKVDVQLGNWGSADGQRVPGTITRVENGEPVLALTITSAAVTARADDGSFDKP